MGTKKKKVTRKQVRRRNVTEPTVLVEPSTSIQTSARLRHTLEIARLAGFGYEQNKKNQWGGFFNIYQLEVIEGKLRELDLLKREAALVKKASGK